MYELEAGTALEQYIVSPVAYEVGPPLGMLAVGGKSVGDGAGAQSGERSNRSGGRTPTDAERAASEAGRDADRPIGDIEREREQGNTSGPRHGVQ